MAIARRLAVVGELYARRAIEWAERQLWCADPFEEVAAEVSAAANVGRGRAGTQIRYARELRERLPRLAAVFATGDIDCWPSRPPSTEGVPRPVICPVSGSSPPSRCAIRPATPSARHWWCPATRSSRGIGLRRRWPSSSAGVISRAGGPDVMPRCAISTTPCPFPAARRIRRISRDTVAFII